LEEAIRKNEKKKGHRQNNLFQAENMLALFCLDFTLDAEKLGLCEGKWFTLRSSATPAQLVVTT
jgi:hypothetical protein